MFHRPTPTSIFPIYLLPSIPFRRRKTSTDSTSSTSTTSSTTPTPYLKGHTSHLRCAKCSTDICLSSQIISKGFTGRHGRAYLVSPTTTTPPPYHPTTDPAFLPNTKTDPPSQRQLVTGIHTVSDVRCAPCGSMLGWKYDGAEEESQRYKVGKYILETKMVCTSSDWEHEEEERVMPAPPPLSLEGGAGGGGGGVGSGAVEFDSQDEDECEDLFAGVWSPALAGKRRRNREFRRQVLEEGRR